MLDEGLTFGGVVAEEFIVQVTSQCDEKSTALLLFSHPAPVPRASEQLPRLLHGARRWEDPSLELSI
jgi:hypothetical protein